MTQEQGLKTEVERYLGDTITNSEYVEAKKYADRKLKIIIEREGDEDGERCKPYYLAQLISETVGANRFSVTTVTHIRAFKELLDYADKMFSLGKKKCPCHKTQGTL